MFQFRRFPSHTYLIQCGIPCGGFPHSEISGSMLICSSPKLIAAYRVLHRLLMPRHSPCALISLTSCRRHFCLQPSVNYIESSISVPMTVELCRLMFGSFYSQKLYFTLIKSFPLLLPSHNCIIIHNVQFSRCMFEFLYSKRLNEASTRNVGTSVNLFSGLTATR